jgi:hypothetical protein
MPGIPIRRLLIGRSTPIICTPLRAYILTLAQVSNRPPVDFKYYGRLFTAANVADAERREEGAVVPESGSRVQLSSC